MGFGWMFLGTIFFWTAKIEYFDLLPDFLGYLLIIHGIEVALRHCNNFKNARIASYVGCGTSAVVLLMQAIQLIDYDDVIPDTILSIINAVNVAVRVAFIIILLLAIHALSKEIKATRTSKRSLQALFVVPLFVLFNVALEAIAYLGLIEDTEKIIAGALLCEIVYVAMTFVTVFSSYMWICLEGDEKMEKKNKTKSPMDYFDDRKAKDQAENAQYQKEQNAAKAGKTMAQMYGVKKKKKGKK
ncbi:MAG: hypothetical protein MJ236_00025 [Clostridia bacterium]|nr:hypothetical protein [Clostridia bacterium]